MTICRSHAHALLELIETVPVAFHHSHSKINGLETPEKVLLYAFVHFFFVDMSMVLRSRHMGKPNLNNACILKLL